MTASREFIQVTVQDLVNIEIAANRLTAILNRISDRLDTLEGLRDAAVIAQPLRVTDSDDNTIHSMGT